MGVIPYANGTSAEEKPALREVEEISHGDGRAFKKR
jgi:hypothetical protein